MEKRISNKLFIRSVKIYEDFFKLIYHRYGLWIIRKDESRGIKELLENTWLKSDKSKIRIGSPSICCQWKWISTCKNSGINRTRFNHWLQKQAKNRWFPNTWPMQDTSWVDGRRWSNGILGNAIIPRYI